ncbi:MAG: tRNA dihydrouridine synthase DusB [Rhizobiales bacterium]|nr:tRNA dihydrouridine synthase DusB [Hyphomicrobiales bacterium]
MQAFADLAAPLAIGPVTIPNRVFLAPMSGVSDRPMRMLAARFGAGLVVSEMVASEQLAVGHPESVMRAERSGAGPHVVQLAGREAHWMAEGARAATDAGADIIDINMGCPAKKVTSGYSGSALMRDLDHALTLIEATVGATSLPVTLKMRLGWDEKTMNAPELARRAEAAGVRMVTVHGRTRCQFYEGRADWTAIRRVKDAISIPLVANGDLTNPDEAAAMLAASGADGVMVGRGAYGRPWLPGAIAARAAGCEVAAPSGAALADLVSEHYEAMLAHYGEPLGLRCARKHLGWYADRLAPCAEVKALRAAMMGATSPREVMRLIAALFGEGGDRMEAA